jgi:hypothetical protein
MLVDPVAVAASLVELVQQINEQQQLSEYNGRSLDG